MVHPHGQDVMLAIPNPSLVARYISFQTDWKWRSIKNRGGRDEPLPLHYRLGNFFSRGLHFGMHSTQMQLKDGHRVVLSMGRGEGEAADAVSTQLFCHSLKRGRARYYPRGRALPEIDDVEIPGSRQIISTRSESKS